MGAGNPIWHPSPNFGDRRGGVRPGLIVLHYTAMNSAQAAIARMCDPLAEVSAHYLIAKSGTLWQMVDEPMRAWHAGAGRWHDCIDVNSASIGIELDNDGCQPFPEPQMAVLETLLRDIMHRWQIAPEGVIAHSDMAPGRKSDPGARFDWQRLARQGLAAKPRAATPASSFRSAAMAAGYTADVDDATLLAAIRLRHRPHATGPLDDIDRALLAGLA